MMEGKNDVKYRSYVYALKIIKFIDILDRKQWSVEVISKQLLRCATSIGANIIEAQAGSSKRDFTNFLSHALKSANECKFWLGLFRDSGKCDTKEANGLLNETGEIANILGASIATLRGKRKL